MPAGVMRTTHPQEQMNDPSKKMTLSAFHQKRQGQAISWLACYDYPPPYLHDQAGVDRNLVGDSPGMAMPVTVDHMAYPPSVESAILNAGRFMTAQGNLHK